MTTPRFRSMTVDIIVRGAVDDGTDLHPASLLAATVPYASFAEAAANGLAETVAEVVANAAAAEVSNAAPPAPAPAPNRAQRRSGAK